MNRREFLTALGVVGAGSQLAAQGPPGLLGSAIVRPDWLARHQEPILEPDLPIIDPHHHLWIRPGSRYLADDLLADLNSGHNIVATVYVQAQSMYRQGGPSEMRSVGETEFVNGVAAMFASGVLGRPRACAGIVGRADLTLGSRVEPVLLAHLRAGGDRFRGVRHITSWDADTRLNNPDYPSPPGLLRDGTFREGIGVLARLGLSFDAMVYHPQLERGRRPCRRLSEPAYRSESLWRTHENRRLSRAPRGSVCPLVRLAPAACNTRKRLREGRRTRDAVHRPRVCRAAGSPVV